MVVALLMMIPTDVLRIKNTCGLGRKGKASQMQCSACNEPEMVESTLPSHVPASRTSQNCLKFMLHA